MPASDTPLSDLRQLIADRQVLVILGEGISWEISGQDPRATWKGLLLDGIARCAEQPHVDADWCERQRALVERGRTNEQVSVAGHIEEELGGREEGGEFRRWLRESVGALRRRDTRLVQAIGALGCPLATTTPDLLVSDALGLPAVSWDESAEVERVLRGHARGVLHLHGHWRRPESLVLGVRDRAQLAASQHASAVLTALRTTRSLLFLGAGDPLDPNLAAWLRWSGQVFAGSEYRNYRLEPDLRADVVQRSHPPEQRLYVLGYGTGAEDLRRALVGLGPRLSAGAPPPAAEERGAQALEALRALARDADAALPDAFCLSEGPHALSEITVELVLSGALDEPEPEALHRRSREGIRRHGEGVGELPSRPFPLWDLLGMAHRRWMILGDPGSGKTTSLRGFAARIAKETSLVPVLLRFTELTELDATLESLAPGSAAPFWTAAGRGEVVLLVDGLDEVAEPAVARRALEALSVRAGPSLLVCASRSGAYERVGGRVRHLALRPLEREQQERLLRAWLPEARRSKAPAILDGLGARMVALAENPLILTLIARLARAEQPLPRRRVELYGDVLRLLLTRGHSPELLSQQRPFADPADPMLALGWLALHGHAEDQAGLTVAAIRARLASAPEPVREARGEASLADWLRRASDGAGVLEPGRNRDTYTFAHRTFREYLAACALRDDVVARGGVTRCGLGSELDLRLQEAAQKPALWAEVFALLTGLLAGGEAEALVKRLVEGGERYKPLLYRVLADAEGLKEETVWGVLGLAAGRGEWEKRSEVLRGLPALVVDLGTAVRLLGRFARAAEHGADLWWVHHLLVEISAGRLGEGEEEVRAEAGVLARRVFREHRPEARAAVLAEIARRGWWKPIPKGSFWMGSDQKTDPDRYDDEGPRHRVEVLRGFELLAVPVTNTLYEGFDPGHAVDREDFSGRLPKPTQAEVPVYNVSWYEATAFALWLSAGGAPIRLPSEVEWEYACRGGTETRFWSGGKDEDLYAVGWVFNNSGRHPHPVATPPTPRGHEHRWGLYDLHGNVWEWCSDARAGSYEAWKGGRQHDPAAEPGTGEPAAPRVFRGGGWDGSALSARSACRGDWGPRDRDRALGFRLVRISPE